MEDPVKQLGYKRRVSNKPPEPDGSTLVGDDGPSTREVVGNGDSESGGSGILRRILELLEGLAGKLKGDSSGGDKGSASTETKLTDDEQRGMFKGGYDENGKYETGSQRKRRIYAEQGKELFEQRIEKPKSSVKTSKSNASASAEAAATRAEKRRKARNPEQDNTPEQDAPKQSATPAESDKSGTGEDQWRQNTDQKLEDLAQMILGLPEDIIKRLQEG